MKSERRKKKKKKKVKRKRDIGRVKRVYASRKTVLRVGSGVREFRSSRYLSFSLSLFVSRARTLNIPLFNYYSVPAGSQLVKLDAADSERIWRGAGKVCQRSEGPWPPPRLKRLAVFLNSHFRVYSYRFFFFLFFTIRGYCYCSDIKHSDRVALLIKIWYGGRTENRFEVWKRIFKLVGKKTSSLFFVRVCSSPRIVIIVVVNLWILLAR